MTNGPLTFVPKHPCADCGRHNSSIPTKPTLWPHFYTCCSAWKCHCPTTQPLINGVAWRSAVNPHLPSFSLLNPLPKSQPPGIRGIPSPLPAPAVSSKPASKTTTPGTEEHNGGSLLDSAYIPWLGTMQGTQLRIAAGMHPYGAPAFPSPQYPYPQPKGSKQNGQDSQDKRMPLQAELKGKAWISQPGRNRVPCQPSAVMAPAPAPAPTQTWAWCTLDAETRLKKEEFRSRGRDRATKATEREKTASSTKMGARDVGGTRRIGPRVINLYGDELPQNMWPSLPEWMQVTAMDMDLIIVGDDKTEFYFSDATWGMLTPFDGKEDSCWRRQEGDGPWPGMKLESRGVKERGVITIFNGGENSEREPVLRKSKEVVPGTSSREHCRTATQGGTEKVVMMSKHPFLRDESPNPPTPSRDNNDLAELLEKAKRNDEEMRHWMQTVVLKMVEEEAERRREREKKSLPK